ncbi:hypothetical protein [Mycolicibacterium sp.]|uniref:hypothetical protein n=1 Tax=Mycolicibacterium sp. TaxID=2320850 RepID=UPI0028A63C4C|nr:hypothetical protein [Mycolicibacterium sp.]
MSFPALLMLFTLGLQRLESLVHGDPPSACEVVTRLERAARAARQKAAHRTLTELASSHPASQPPPRFDPVLLIDEPGLPTRPNPLFQPTGFANRV